QVQERRGRLRAWNFGLVILAFLLVVFGTFIVRSGILPSVHTFAVSVIGPWFFAFLLICVAFSAALLAFRAGGLKSSAEPPAAVSRESAFVLQNLLLVGAIAVILWGTVLPLVSGMAGAERVVDANYYQRAAGPLLVALLAVMAAGPLLPWRRAGASWLRALRLPAAAAVLVALAMVISGVRSIAALLAIPLAVAAAATCAVEFGRAIARGRRQHGWPGAFAPLAQKRRRYGAYLAHVGLVVIA